MFFESIIRGSYVFEQNYIYHMITIAMRVLKTYILSVLEMFKVRITLHTVSYLQNDIMNKFSEEKKGYEFID